MLPSSLPALPRRASRGSGSTQLELLLRGAAPRPGGPHPRGALFEIRRVLARERIQWALPRRRNLLILACERGVDLAVVACLLRAFYRQRRLALFDGTRKLLVADREAALWAAGSAPSSGADGGAPCSLSILARLFLLDNVDFHDCGSPSLHLPVLLAAVRSLDDAWAVQVLLHPRVEPAVAKLVVPGIAMGSTGSAAAGTSGKDDRGRQRKFKAQRLALGYLIECVRAAVKARMDGFLRQLEGVNPAVTRAAAAFCTAHSTSPLLRQYSAQGGGAVPSLLVKRFHRDLLWHQVGALVLARMESARRRKLSVWHLFRAWRQHSVTMWISGSPQASGRMLVVLPDGLFRLIVSYLSVSDDADVVLAALADCDEEDR